MRIDIGYILGHLSEFVLFLYFAETSFLPISNRVKRFVYVFVGYSALFLIGFASYSFVSIISFWVINCILLLKIYKLNLKSAVFYAFILDLLSCMGEYIIIFAVGIDTNSLISVTPQQSFAVTLGGKLFYFITIVILRHFVKGYTGSDKYSLIMSSIPFISMVCLLAMVKYDIDIRLFYLICGAITFMNIVSFIVIENLNRRNIEFRILQEEHERDQEQFTEYKIIAEKYENTRIMQHDFNSQIKALKQIIKSESRTASNHIGQLEAMQREISYAKYTDSIILNILLDQKIKECANHGVSMKIQSTYASFNFMTEMDIVSVFSNLIDNAREAAERSDDKFIFVDLYTVNNNFSAVKIQNSSDTEPVVSEGVLKTQKSNSDNHGIGIKSVNKVLKKYNANLYWKYDPDKMIFRITFIIKNFTSKIDR